jgi:DNA-binding SARP family transcriptional activator
MTQSSNTCPAPSRVAVSLIRDLEVRCDGEPLNIPPTSQRLVGFFAFQERPVRRSYVSGTLWFNSDEYRASASLRSALWRLPSLPGLALVDASQTHIWLHPDVRIDLREVMDRAMAVLSGRATDIQLMDVARELAQFGDDVLVGWYEDWVIMERERFRQIRLHVLDRIGEQLLIHGRLCDAFQVGLAAVRAEPLRESAHCLLIQVYLREGNVAEAVRQYRSYSDLLRHELQARPSPVISSLLRPYFAGS